MGILFFKEYSKKPCDFFQSTLKHNWDSVFLEYSKRHLGILCFLEYSKNKNRILRLLAACSGVPLEVFGCHLGFFWGSCQRKRKHRQSNGLFDSSKWSF